MGRQRLYLNYRPVYKRTYRYGDYGFLAIHESASAVVTGAETLTLSVNPLTGAGTLTWTQIQIYSAITGATVTIPAGSTSIADGEVLYIPKLHHPMRTETKTLETGSPRARRTRNVSNMFLGCRVGNDIIFTANGIKGNPAVEETLFYEYPFIPISVGEDDGTPPAALELFTHNSGKIRLRRFSGTVTNGVIIPWEVPTDLDVDYGLRYQVLGVVTEATGPASQGAVFQLGGYSVGVGDDIDGAFAGHEESQTGLMTHSQYDRFKSNWSTTVTIPNLSTGDQTFLHLQRYPGHVSDTYTQNTGIYGVNLKYMKRART